MAPKAKLMPSAKKASVASSKETQKKHVASKPPKKPVSKSESAEKQIVEPVPPADFSAIVEGAVKLAEDKGIEALVPIEGMTLAEYIGGLSHHTNIPKTSLASLANVSLKTVNNWKNTYVFGKERAERSKPAIEALSKVIDLALENYRVNHPGKAPPTMEVWMECRKIWEEDTHDVFALPDGSGKMEMPSLSTVRRCL